MQRINSPTTHELLCRVQQGDQSAPSLLLARHRGRLRQMVAARLDARLTARVDPSDVVQESLLEAARQLPDYLQHRPLPFYPWLRQIAWQRLAKLHTHHIETQCRSILREENPQPFISDESLQQLSQQLVTHGTSPSRQFVRQELMQRVRAALLKLDEQDRELLLLRFLEHLAPREVAAVLGLSEATARVRQLRALAKLRQVLDQSGESHP